MAQLGGKTERTEMAAAAIGSGTPLNRALQGFPHSFPHNFQHIFLKRVQKSSGVLLG